MNKTKDLQNLFLAATYGMFSKDPSTKVGAYIVDKYNRPVSFGRNGFASGIQDSSERLNNRDVKLALTIHAEENAILLAKASDFEHCTLYVTKHPCASCASRIVQKKILRVVYLEDQKFEKRWEDSRRLAREVFEEAGVQLVRYTEEQLVAAVDPVVEQFMQLHER